MDWRQFCEDSDVIGPFVSVAFLFEKSSLNLPFPPFSNSDAIEKHVIKLTRPKLQRYELRTSNPNLQCVSFSRKKFIWKKENNFSSLLPLLYNAKIDIFYKFYIFYSTKLQLKVPWNKALLYCNQILTTPLYRNRFKYDRRLVLSGRLLWSLLCRNTWN